ncbi:hypothetical protein ASF61_18640 [Duganella sp. Leaf126]|uniref:hypothetical protein n=1 Tax=Duganella sp. Leaf126 TaxID=1736266 RepID=UPI000701F5E5|nr:hypothetical protein [Duganella sp. Leaf126]KQQ46409.1 hypothetical protein ASF61_18640 [Duganella sp. Leaf126]
MTLREPAAQTLRPQPEQAADFTSYLPERHTAPQSWYASVATARMHWYDLIAGFPERPDIHDPIGRYQRRMQFELEAVASMHHLFFVLTRTPVRFDTAAAVHWGFFSLKLTLPLLVGAEQRRDSITFELTVPFAATLKKPTVKLTANFVTLNWGGLVETFSIHDILQAHAPDKVPCQVVYVGTTFDPEAQLSRARLPALQKLHARHKEDLDTLLLVQQFDIDVRCASGDPASMPHNAHPRAAAILQGERMELLAAALIRHFEGPASATRKPQERQARRERVTAAQQANNLVQFTLDLQWPDIGAYDRIGSGPVAPASRHLLSCFVADGDVVVAAMTPPEPPVGTRLRH